MKELSSISDLAIMGGIPAFNEKLYVGCPNIGDRSQILAAINDILDRRWLTNDGIYVQQFEQKLAAMLGAKHCITVCNGTVALEIAIRAIGLTGEVIVPSFTFIATAHSLQWQQIKPVFCDIDPDTHCIDSKKVEELITHRTTGIIGVHVWGRPCAIEDIYNIAQRNNLKLLFDAAHAFGCSSKGRMIGNFGDAEVFSFHATKFFNTFEGGAIATNDDQLAAQMRLMRNFGFAGYDKVIDIGTNGKMTEISAAMGLASLGSIDKFIAANYRNYSQYRRELSELPGVKLIQYDESERANFQYIILEIDDNITHVSRDALVDILHAENIMARRYFYPGCHQMEPYKSSLPDANHLLPHTNQLVKSVMSLPTGTSVGPDDITTICKIIRMVAANGKAVRSVLQARASAVVLSKNM